MNKILIAILFFSYTQTVFSQDTLLRYKCTDLNNLPVTLEVMVSDEPVNYLRTKIFINKYELRIADTLYSTFYTYKYKNRLYILDKSATKINCVKDQVLFDKIYRSELKIDSVDGVMEHLELQFDREISVNNKKFYIYSTDEYNFSELTVNKLTFDDDRDIAMLGLQAFEGSCSCSKQDVVIKSLESKKLYNSKFNHKEYTGSKPGKKKKKSKK